jgi:excisionase family DNA binding protein
MTACGQLRATVPLGLVAHHRHLPCRTRGLHTHRHMKHLAPPENLPVLPSQAPSPAPDGPVEDVPFRGEDVDDIVATSLAGATAPGLAARSLQSSRRPMTTTTPAMREPDNLIDAAEVARVLSISRTAVYRYAAERRLPHYRLPAGLRFLRRDVDVFLQSCRQGAAPTYGRQEAQR